MKTLYLDIETTPIKAYVWGLWDQNVSINQIIEPTEMLCFGARWGGSKKVIFKSVHHDGKKARGRSQGKALWLSAMDRLYGWRREGLEGNEEVSDSRRKSTD
jgi:hypothetical protein